MDTINTPSSANRFLASFKRGYIIVSQLEWKRPFALGFDTRGTPSSSNCPDALSSSSLVEAKESAYTKSLPVL
jgi:hypothetical protein